MTLYNNTWMNTTTSNVDVFVGIGSAIGQPYLFGYLILTTLFLVMVFRLKSLDNQGLAISGFVTSLMGILIYFTGLVDVFGIIVPAIVFFFALIMYFIS